MAYVIAVDAGSVTVTELNFLGWNIAATRTISAQGRLPNGYIYGGSASNECRIYGCSYEQSATTKPL